MKSVQHERLSKQYRCWKCLAVNEFDPTRIQQILFEGRGKKPGGESPKHAPTVYMIECPHCHQKNRVPV